MQGNCLQSVFGTFCTFPFEVEMVISLWCVFVQELHIMILSMFAPQQWYIAFYCSLLLCILPVSTTCAPLIFILHLSNLCFVLCFAVFILLCHPLISTFLLILHSPNPYFALFILYDDPLNFVMFNNNVHPFSSWWWYFAVLIFSLYSFNSFILYVRATHSICTPICVVFFNLCYSWGNKRWGSWLTIDILPIWFTWW
jgi:hypothetical protein